MGALETFDILIRLRAAGLTVRADGDRLIVRPASNLTDDLRALISANRESINAELENEQLLARLVRRCGEHKKFTVQEHAEALQAALADPVNALTCFRSIANNLRNCKP
jgi:virulence-associated protein VagC